MNLQHLDIETGAAPAVDNDSVTAGVKVSRGKVRDTIDNSEGPFDEEGVRGWSQDRKNSNPVASRAFEVEGDAEASQPRR